MTKLSFIFLLLVSSSLHGLSGFEPPGSRLRVMLDSLPEPYEEDAFSNSPRTVPPPPNWRPLVADGWRVSIFAQDLRGAREMTKDARGFVYVTIPYDDEIVRLQESPDGNTIMTRCLDDFDFPYGIEFHNNSLYVADSYGVWRLAGDDPCLDSDPTLLTPPHAMGRARGHRSRNLAIAPDGASFFVAIGSIGNIADEPSPHATIQQFTIDGKPVKTYASGLRNPVGLAFNPADNTLWTSVNERDWLGDRLVPDYVTRVQEDGFYGWPYAYLGGIPQPDYAELAPDKVAATLLPDVLIRAHSAPLGMAFFQGDLFVALHGSWNAGVAQGYIVARIEFKDGKASPHYEVFMTNFRQDDGTDRPIVTGRPASVLAYDDTSILVSDDAAGIIWRITKTD